jgi:hypothetical protein
MKVNKQNYLSAAQYCCCFNETTKILFGEIFHDKIKMTIYKKISAILSYDTDQ